MRSCVCAGLLLAACGGDAEAPTDTAPDAGTSVDTDTEPIDPTTGGPDPDQPPASCALTGTWTLAVVKCGTANITADYESVYVFTELQIAQSPQGGCDIEAIVSSRTCEQREDWYTDDGVQSGAVIQRQGVTSCSPSGCKFSPQHQKACKVGSLVEVDTVDIDDFLPGHLVFLGLFEELVPQCGGDLKMAFSGP